MELHAPASLSSLSLTFLALAFVSCMMAFCNRESVAPASMNRVTSLSNFGTRPSSQPLSAGDPASAAAVKTSRKAHISTAFAMAARRGRCGCVGAEKPAIGWPSPSCRAFARATGLHCLVAERTCYSSSCSRHSTAPPATACHSVHAEEREPRQLAAAEGQDSLRHAPCQSAQGRQPTAERCYRIPGATRSRETPRPPVLPAYGPYAVLTYTLYL